ncbi:GNAT family N-acetyltransferase [Allokutzneria multivorans]|uniref:GNAT family N-acetyltransferase n=1 Tax=Allokutzneria multivorans TaxID=1142134 RepID=A0ABP7QSJ3_9PSEU
MTSWTFAALAPAHPDATQMIRNYFREIIGRYHGRSATWAEVDEEMGVDPSDDLPLLVVAYADGTAAGCLGMRLLEPGTGELTRMFVEPEWRGHGVGALLIAEVERLALADGVTALRLDTRSDLVEARRLYASQGYREIPAYNHGPYAQHWFEKRLEPNVTR